MKQCTIATILAFTFLFHFANANPAAAQVKTTEKYNEPGRFSAFHGYEFAHYYPGQ